MGHRLSKIYTRTGDEGETGLGDGSRIKKSDVRITTLGVIDELNSSIGIVLSFKPALTVHQALTGVQHTLFDLGGEICVPGRNIISAKDIIDIEAVLDGFNEKLLPLKEFILPGGCQAAAFCHQARTICRRAESTLISLNAVSKVNKNSLKYLNRLSDFLFVTARYINHLEKTSDILWNPKLKSQNEK